MPNKNNLPTYFEELRLDSESTISAQAIISQLKQQIPADYLEIIAEEGNYCGSTNPKWKDKPLSERYGFTHEGEWIQIDIPHSIMEKLGLDKNKEDKDISQPFYLNPQVLTRKETYKGINIENEEEIVLVNPHKIVVKDLGIQTELDNKKLEKTETELEREKEKNNKLNSEVIQLKADLVKAQQEKQNLQNTINSLQNQITTKNNQISGLNSTIGSKDRELAQKNNQITSLNSQVSSLSVEKNNLQNQVNTLKGQIDNPAWIDKFVDLANTKPYGVGADYASMINSVKSQLNFKTQGRNPGSSNRARFAFQISFEENWNSSTSHFALISNNFYSNPELNNSFTSNTIYSNEVFSQSQKIMIKVMLKAMTKL